MSAPGPRSTTAVRLGVANFTLFGIVGLVAPFWPLFLEHRGMSPPQIGWLLALGPWAKLASNLGVGQLGARLLDPTRLLRPLAVALALVYVAFAYVDGFVAFFLVSAVVGLLFAPLAPLLDALCLAAGRDEELPYGRLRVWGSIAFIVVSSLGGLALVTRSEAYVLPGVIGCCLAFAVSTWALRAPSRPPPDPLAAELAGSLSLLRRPELRRVVLTVATLHGSHAVLYGFGSQTFRASGIPDEAIGWLWAEGTVFEVVVFAAGHRITRRFGARSLLAWGALAGVVRWSVLAVDVSWPAVVATQALHGATFGCMHLGAMTYLRDRVGPTDTPQASTLLAGVGSGLVLALALPAAGWLYAALGTQAFGAAALTSSLALALALSIAPREPRTA